MNIGNFAGRIGQDAEIRYTGGGQQVAGFSLAVDQRKGGEKSTLWLDCSIWGERAEKLAPYLTKGTPVAVAGEIGVRTYEKRDGTTQATITVNVRELTLLGKGGGSEGGESAAAPRAQPQSKPQASAPAQADGFDDDDIPF
jgi:single-strand DNA-binding protein